LAKKRRCCGRPAFSQGNLDAAAEVGKHNVDLLNGIHSSMPILFLEPSCYSMFVEDYCELKINNAGNVAKRCSLFEKFVDDLLASDCRSDKRSPKTHGRIAGGSDRLTTFSEEQAVLDSRQALRLRPVLAARRPRERRQEVRCQLELPADQAQ